MLSTNIPGMWAAQNQHKPGSVFCYPERHIVSMAQTRVNGRLLRKDSKGGVRSQWLMCKG